MRALTVISLAMIAALAGFAAETPQTQPAAVSLKSAAPQKSASGVHGLGVAHISLRTESSAARETGPLFVCNQEQQARTEALRQIERCLAVNPGDRALLQLQLELRSQICSK